jgi:dCMP deaminase
MVKNRITRDELYLQICELLTQRSTCQRLGVGCVITSAEGRVLATGYNGPPKNGAHCTEITCDLSTSCKRALHAEINAIGYCAEQGISIQGGILYCSYAPCLSCAQAIVASGIQSVVYKTEFRDNSGLLFLMENNIKVKHGWL